MQFGISTACLYPELTENSLDLLQKLGFNCFEIFLNSFSELQDSYISDIKSRLSLNNGRVVSVHPFMSGDEPFLLFSDYYRRFLDTVEYYCNFFKCCSSLGAEYVIIHGDRKTAENGISDEEYFERFAILSQKAQKFGVTLLQENVYAFRSQRISFIKKMKSYLGSTAKFNFDLKQAVRAGENPFEMCSAMGKNLYNIHINDNDSKNDCLLPGEGTFNYKKLFGLLNDVKYNKACIIEVYSRNFKNTSQLVNAYNFIKNVT